jgi:hypothetical protein
LYKCHAIATAIQYLLLPCLIRFPFSHTCIPFTFPRFLCITHSAHHARDVTPHMPQHGNNAVAGQCGAGSHLPRRNRHPLPGNSVENVGNCESRYLKSHGQTNLDRLDIALQLQLQFIIYFLSVSSVFHFQTHAFCSLFRVFYALRTVHITPVMSQQHAPQHGYNAVAGQCGAGSHLPRRNRHPLPTTSFENVGNCESRYFKSHGRKKIG